MNVLGYVRVSTDRQETDRQIVQIRTWCEANHHVLVKIVEEPEGISGRAAAVRRGPDAALQYYAALAGENFGLVERAGWATLLRDLAQRNLVTEEGDGVYDPAEPESIDIVAVYALDRIARDCLELLLLQLLFARYGAVLVCIAEGGVIDTSSAAGKFLFRVLAAKAELECDQTSERTAATLRTMVSRGAKVGRPPIGWRAVKDAAGSTVSWEHDPATWPKVERVAALRAEGKRYRDIEAAVGISASRVGAYLDAARWVPPGSAAPSGPPAPAAPVQGALQLDGDAPASYGAAPDAPTPPPPSKEPAA